MAAVKVPVSIGELVDKVTILRIKTRMIDNQDKLKNITAELDALEQTCEKAQIDLDSPLVARLENINLKLWQIEDDIREKERASTFDEEFIQLARSVYVTNDERFAAKSAINQKYGSLLREEKSYKPY